MTGNRDRIRIVATALAAFAASAFGAGLFGWIAVRGAVLPGSVVHPLELTPVWAGAVLCLVVLGLLVLVLVRPVSELRAPLVIVPVGAVLMVLVSGFGLQVPIVLAIAGAGLVVLLERQVRAALPEEERHGVVPGSAGGVRPAVIDVEAAAAAKVYPYSRPLPAPAQRAHLAAVAAWQRRFNPWCFVGLVGLALLCVSTARGRRWEPGDWYMWNDQPVLAAVLFGGGLLLLGIAAAGGARPILARTRHVRLLAAYGVRLDARGRPRTPQPGPAGF